MWLTLFVLILFCVCLCAFILSPFFNKDAKFLLKSITHKKNTNVQAKKELLTEELKFLLKNHPNKKTEINRILEQLCDL